MTKLTTALVALLMALSPGLALANCTTTTVMLPNGKLITCTTCCYGTGQFRTCNTNCF